MTEKLLTGTLSLNTNKQTYTHTLTRKPSQKCSSLGTVYSNGTFGMKKEVRYFRRGSPEKNELWHNVSAMVMGLTGKLTL